MAALVAADAAAFGSAFNPSIFTIRKFGVEEHTRDDIYRGMALAAGLTMLTAFGASAVTRSYVPTAAAVITLIVIAAAYHWAVSNPRPDARSM